ncbi:MAG: Rrf2 family transcriptional regulator [Acidovorax sp.]|uniref:Rrf2 family transcriptional regulator n=1 Tax=Acidovorax sp. TaxID=1872122 RepID=UPI00391DD13C
MRLTTRSRYALVAIADVALRGSHGPIALSTIGERHGISLSYLEMLFSALRRAGLVASTRGPGGGYSLGRSACDITVADIVLASEQGKNGQLAPDHDTMTAHQGAMTHALWQAFNQAVVDHLSSVTLADVVATQVAAAYVADGNLASAAAPQTPSSPTPPDRSHRPKGQLPRDGVPNSVFALGSAVRAR